MAITNEQIGGRKPKYATDANGKTTIDGHFLAENLSNDSPFIASLFGPVQRKIICKTAADAFYLSIPKAANKSTALVYEIKTGVGTSADSVGGNTQLYRVTKVVEVLRSLVAKHGYAAVNSAGDWTQTTFSLSGQAGAFGAGNWGTAVKYRATTVQNAWIEYSITVGDSGMFTVGFVAGAGKSASVKVAVDGIDRETFTTVASETGLWKKPFSASPGTHTIRVTKLDAGATPMQVFGANFYDAADLPPGNSIDSWAYGRTSTYYKNASLGAIDYAMKVSGGSWSGSYHGGETRTALAVYVDGVDVSGGSVGNITAGYDITIDQETTIATGAGSVSTRSRHRWAESGGHTFSAVMDAGDLEFEYFYTLMDVLEPGFNAVTYPQYIDYSAATETRTPLGPSEMVILRNPTTGQQAATWGRQFGLSGNEYDGMHIWHNPGVYSKPYNGPAVGADRYRVGQISFVSRHAYY